jgi:hypothetical protein
VCSSGAGLQRLHGLRPAVVHGEERPRLRHHVQPPVDDHGGHPRVLHLRSEPVLWQVKDGPDGKLSVSVKFSFA